MVLPWLACQAATAAPAVAPAPPVALGLLVFVEGDASIATVEDAEARPFATEIADRVRAAIHAAGLTLAPTREAASGLVLRVKIEKLSTIHADAFIHGNEACGVVLEVRRGDAVVVSAEPETPCVSTSSYYGASPEEAAATLVNFAVHAPRFVAAAQAIRPVAPAAAVKVR